MVKFSKKAQEEMVGFALIIIVVAVILLFFLGLALTDDETGLDSYEAESFLQASLQYTTSCEISFKVLDLQDLAFECANDNVCGDGNNTCDVLNSTYSELVEKSWQISPESPYKGYELKVFANDENATLVNLIGGNRTSTYKGAIQSFAKSGDGIRLEFRVYA